MVPHDIIHGYRRLLTRIITIAAKDLDSLNESGQDYTDDKHRALCGKLGFESGREELETFFFSPWFEQISDELNCRPYKAWENLGLTEDK